MSKIRVKKVVIEEGAWEALFSSRGKSHIEQVEDALDQHEQDGWGLESLEINCYRTLLFWTRDVTTMTLYRPIALSEKGVELSPSSLGHIKLPDKCGESHQKIMTT